MRQTRQEKRDASGNCKRLSFGYELIKCLGTSWIAPLLEKDPGCSNCSKPTYKSIFAKGVKTGTSAWTDTRIECSDRVVGKLQQESFGPSGRAWRCFARDTHGSKTDS
jgi:hypothetical protein